MLAALAGTPSASAPRVKLLCSATATNTRRLASGARRYAARAAVPAAERWETRPAAAGGGGAVAPFFRRWVSRVTTGHTLLIIRRSTDHTPPGAAASDRAAQRSAHSS